MKTVRLTIYAKLMILILLLLIPILLLYTYSSSIAEGVVKQEIYKSNKNQLVFFSSQMDKKIEEIASYSIMLIRDRALNDYQFIDHYQHYTEVIRAKNTVLDRISLQKATTGWISEISVYAPQVMDVVSTNNMISYDPEYLAQNVRRGWRYDASRSEFVWFTSEPQSGYDMPLKAKLIIETRFPAERIKEMLATYEADGLRYPFLYHAELGMIKYGDLEDPAMGQLTQILGDEGILPEFNRLEELDGDEYLVNVVGLDSFGWYLVDYVPLDLILSPIVKSRNYFYTVNILLILFGFIAALILYRNVQVPIRELLRNMQRLRIGDFSTRIRRTPRNELGILYDRFNAMAEQIQDLIEKVYTEQLHSREATLKQLQSQINPHFLYNCLYYIKNMARLGEDEAVEAMAVNLGEYFRYTTRHENQTPLLEEEVSMLLNYLQIQNLRMKRIRYDIDIPQSMMKLEIPRLLLQPLLENAIIHGIEPKAGEGIIQITGRAADDHYEIIVEDNGVGLSDQGLRDLNKKITMSLEKEMGCGMWNVNQRLIYQYGEAAALQISQSASGGLKVSFKWASNKNDLTLRASGGDRYV